MAKRRKKRRSKKPRHAKRKRIRRHAKRRRHVRRRRHAKRKRTKRRRSARGKGKWKCWKCRVMNEGRKHCWSCSSPRAEAMAKGPLRRGRRQLRNGARAVAQALKVARAPRPARQTLAYGLPRL